jgi:hypothetical protein
LALRNQAEDFARAAQTGHNAGIATAAGSGARASAGAGIADAIAALTVAEIAARSLVTAENPEIRQGQR